MSSSPAVAPALDVAFVPDEPIRFFTWPGFMHMISACGRERVSQLISNSICSPSDVLRGWRRNLNESVSGSRIFWWRTSCTKSSWTRLFSFSRPDAMSLEPVLAPPLLRTHIIGKQPSMKNAHHAEAAASGVFESCVEPYMSTSECEVGLSGGLRLCSRTVKNGPRAPTGRWGRKASGSSLHGGCGFDSYIRCL